MMFKIILEIAHGYKIVSKLREMEMGFMISLLCWEIIRLCGVFSNICRLGLRILGSRCVESFLFGAPLSWIDGKIGLRTDLLFILVRRSGRGFRCMRALLLSSCLLCSLSFWRNPSYNVIITLCMKIYMIFLRNPLIRSSLIVFSLINYFKN